MIAANMLQYVVPFLVTVILAVAGVAEIEPYEDVWVVRTNEPLIAGWWLGLTYGGFIFVSSEDVVSGTTYESTQLQHEYGHILQQRILSVWYLPLVAIPSFVSAIVNDNEDHKTYWVEVWANQLSVYDLGD